MIDDMRESNEERYVASYSSQTSAPLRAALKKDFPAHFVVWKASPAHHVAIPSTVYIAHLCGFNCALESPISEGDEAKHEHAVENASRQSEALWDPFW